MVMMEELPLRMPLIVLERETGRLELLESFADARMFTEEFHDILEDDFRVWDSYGRMIELNSSFQHGDDSALKPGQLQIAEVRRMIRDFLADSGPDTELARALESVMQSLDRDDREP
jgi:hypothetical protein